jgi:P-type Ca2+ transporter type 2C
VILFWPQAQALLKFDAIAWSDMGLAVGCGLLLLVVLEGCKPFVRAGLERRKVSVGHNRAMPA